jgi:hypothetical protein
LVRVVVNELRSRLDGDFAKAYWPWFVCIKAGHPFKARAVPKFLAIVISVALGALLWWCNMADEN